MSLLSPARWHLTGARASSLYAEVTEDELRALADDPALRRQLETFLCELGGLLRGVDRLRFVAGGVARLELALDGDAMRWSVAETVIADGRRGQSSTG